MSLRPLDFQMSINQMGDLAKKEKDKVDKKKNEKTLKDKNLLKGAVAHSQAAVDVDKVEVSGDGKHEDILKINSKSRKEHDEQKEKSKKTIILDKFKGNFLDITE